MRPGILAALPLAAMPLGAATITIDVPATEDAIIPDNLGAQPGAGITYRNRATLGCCAFRTSRSASASLTLRGAARSGAWRKAGAKPAARNGSFCARPVSRKERCRAEVSAARAKSSWLSPRSRRQRRRRGPQDIPGA